jgi:hypothetical protein
MSMALTCELAAVAQHGGALADDLAIHRERRQLVLCELKKSLSNARIHVRKRRKISGYWKTKTVPRAVETGVIDMSAPGPWGTSRPYHPSWPHETRAWCVGRPRKGCLLDGETAKSPPRIVGSA